MDGASSQQLKLKQHSTSQHTRNRNQGVDPLDGNRQSSTNNCMIDKLPDDILIAILSRMSVDDAVRTSVLSSRWRYLWRHMPIYKSEELEFNDMDADTGTKMEGTKFEDLVNHVLKLHRGLLVESLIIRYGNLRVPSKDIDKWIAFAMRNGVEMFELNLSNSDGVHCCYKFPNKNFLSLSHWCYYKSAFHFLRSLILVNVDIEDEVVGYFLASCFHIEELCIIASNTTKNLEIDGTLLYLEVLEISDCCNIQCIEISAKYLISCTYQGREISLPFKKTPNLFDLVLGGAFCESFIYEPNKHSSYSVQLVNLVLNLQAEFPLVHERTIAPPDLPRLHALKWLELNIESEVGQSLLFFASFIKASPRLQKFKIKIDYIVTVPGYTDSEIRKLVRFPEVTSIDASVFDHKNLKVVEMAGYCGCASEENLLVQLSTTAPSIEKIVIDTNSDYYHSSDWVMYRLREQEWEKPIKKKQNMTMTRFDAKKHAQKLASSFASKTEFVIT